MTTDDLKAVAEKYPEWLDDLTTETNYYRTYRGLLWEMKRGVFEIRRGTMEFVVLGEQERGMSPAIFSALLDEIAEDEHGVYLVRKARAKTVNQSDPNAPWGETVWSWQARDIKTFQLRGDHPTKLAALLSL